MARAPLAEVALFGLIVGLMLGFYAISPFTDALEIPFTKSRLGDLFLFGFSAVAFFTLSTFLFRAVKWAWGMTNIICILVLALSLWMGWLAYNPRDDYARLEGGGIIFFAILLGFPSTVSLILLNLRVTKQVLRAANEKRVK